MNEIRNVNAFFQFTVNFHALFYLWICLMASPSVHLSLTVKCTFHHFCSLLDGHDEIDENGIH